jgi:hypothetical protein
MAIRNALIAIALAFAVWETSDIPDTGTIAAVFALLFFACSLWLWRRNSRIAAVVLALQFTIEATQAHTWKDASPTAKDAALALGTAGNPRRNSVSRPLPPRAARNRTCNHRRNPR